MNLIEITDIDAPQLDVFVRKTERELRTCNAPDEGLFMAESAYVIRLALEKGYEPCEMLVEKGRLDIEAAPVLEAVRQYCGDKVADSLPVYVAEHELVMNMRGYALVRGLWMTMRRKPEISVEEFCKDKSRIAVLIDVVSPTNVGAIIRTAAALGMDGVLLTHASVDPLTRRTSRVSMGTVFQIPWVQASLEDSNGLDLVNRLSSYGFKTVAMALTEDSTSVDSDEIRSNEKVAVLLGTEGTGLPKDVINSCDYRVMIPMFHEVDSLNVGAAAAISFWELMKDRKDNQAL